MSLQMSLRSLFKGKAGIEPHRNDAVILEDSLLLQI